jgi:hypothetical protein
MTKEQQCHHLHSPDQKPTQNEKKFLFSQKSENVHLPRAKANKLGSGRDK